MLQHKAQRERERERENNRAKMHISEIEKFVSWATQTRLETFEECQIALVS